MGEESDTSDPSELPVSGMTEYRQQQLELRERTARLRELRLQRQQVKHAARAPSDDRKSA